MPVVYFRQLGGNLAFVAPVEGLVDPGFGLGGGSIDNTLPGGGGHPWLPGHGGGGNRPDNSLPGGAGHPDARPPSHPPVVAPGETLALIRDPEGVWHYASFDASTPPPKPVPVPPYPTTGPVPPVPTPV